MHCWLKFEFRLIDLKNCHCLFWHKYVCKKKLLTCVKIHQISIKEFIFWWAAWSFLQSFWKESPSQVFIKNLKHKIQKSCSEKTLMSLDGVLLFLSSYWLFLCKALIVFHWKIFSRILWIWLSLVKLHSLEISIIIETRALISAKYSKLFW